MDVRCDRCGFSEDEADIRVREDGGRTLCRFCFAHAAEAAEANAAAGGYEVFRPTPEERARERGLVFRAEMEDVFDVPD